MQLVPLFADEGGRPDPFVAAWREGERRKDAEIKAKVVSDKADLANLLRRYCVDMRPGMSRALEHGAYERATRTCELLFCTLRVPFSSPPSPASIDRRCHEHDEHDYHHEDGLHHDHR